APRHRGLPAQLERRTRPNHQRKVQRDRRPVHRNQRGRRRLRLVSGQVERRSDRMDQEIPAALRRWRERDSRNLRGPGLRGGEKMIVEYIRYLIAEADREAFEAAYRQAQAALTRSPHCLAYELSHCTDDRGSYILRIEWDSSEGHLKGFRSSAEFREFLASVRPFVGAIAEMRHYEVTSVCLRK